MLPVFVETFVTRNWELSHQVARVPPSLGNRYNVRLFGCNVCKEEEEEEEEENEQLSRHLLT